VPSFDKPRIPRWIQRGLACCCGALAAATSAQSAADAAPEQYSIDAQASFVQFEIRLLATTTLLGRLGPAMGKVVLDRTHGGGEIDVSVPTASVSTGFAPWDHFLRGQQGFDAQHAPQITFIAHGLHFSGATLASVSGELNLRGESHLLTLTATRFACQRDEPSRRDVCEGSFEGQVRRSEFGMTTWSAFLADPVSIVVHVNATRDDDSTER